MGDFFITEERLRKRRDTPEIREHEEWFLDKQHFIKGPEFLETLPDTKINLRRWCQRNLEGDVVVEKDSFMGRLGTAYKWIFWFELESDAAAFKLRWI